MVVSTPAQAVSFVTTLGLGMQICPTFPTRQPYPLGGFQKYRNVILSCNIVLIQDVMALQIFSRFFQPPFTADSLIVSHSRQPNVAELGASCALTWVLSKPPIPRHHCAFALLCSAFSKRMLTASAAQAGTASSAPLVKPQPQRENVEVQGEEGIWSVIIPTYNRLPILTKCLEALEEQEGYELSGIKQYEVVVVDDGSTDGTLQFLQPMDVLQNHNKLVVNKRTRDGSLVEGIDNSLDEECGSQGQEEALLSLSLRFPHVKVIKQQHGGATRARNLGIGKARGAVLVFIDSDLVVTKDFLKEHGDALMRARLQHSDDLTFTYGRVVNTANFEDPKSEKFKLTDNSAAFFATGNVALSRRLLLKAGSLLKGVSEGPFDADFSEYGWEDLELGVRLKQVGARIKHVPLAVGYHWHPAFSMDQIPKLINQERQRGRNGVQFFLKHPSLNVRLMTQLTPLHEGIWFLLTLGGLVTEKTLSPILHQLVVAGHPGLAAALLSPTLNWHTVQATKEEVKRLKKQGRLIQRKT